MDWRFSTFLLFLFALFFGITWATSQDGLCNSQFILDVLALQNKDGALNCFDFWLNRYQTLIGAIAATILAVIAARLLTQQTKAMTRQAAADRYRFATERIDEIRRALADAEILFRLSARELHPERIIRVSGEPKYGLAHEPEIARPAFLDAITTGQSIKERLRQTADANALPTATYIAVRAFDAAMHFYLLDCQTDAFPATNLGLFMQMVPEPETLRRTPKSHRSQQEVGDCYRRLQDAAEADSAELIQSRDAARTAAL